MKDDIWQLAVTKSIPEVSLVLKPDPIHLFDSSRAFVEMSVMIFSFILFSDGRS
jgi:hypothetical protein